MPANAPTSEPTGRPPIALGVLLAVACLFLVVRVPLMLRQFGGQDEDYYAVPGWTILRDGVPRIPYVPSRDPDSVFYKADEVLFALPPLYFYWQAAVYSITGPSYGAGRLASGIAGLVAVGFVYLLGKRWYARQDVALWAAGLYAFSRIFFFPATFARPDMLCATLSLATVWALWQWRQTELRRWLVLSGALAGLAMLTHPFALVPCLQLGATVLIVGTGVRAKCTAAALWTLSALAAFALWLPLIRGHEDVFQAQFVNNVLGRSGPGLIHRFLLPWDSFAAQSQLLYEHAGPIQLALMIAGLLVATSLDIRSKLQGPAFNLALAWSGVYLLIVCQGTHPAKGYWCYPGAFLFLAVARSITSCCDWLRLRAAKWSRPAVIATSLLIAALMLPGSGLRACWAHLRHWNHPDYDRRAFVARLLADLPQDARYLVDVSYVLDFYLAGRQPVLALNIPPYFEAEGRPYDYLIVGPTGIEQQLPRQLQGRFLRSYGLPHNPFACYAEVYSRSHPSHEKHTNGR